MKMHTDIQQRTQKIKLVIFDVDGVFTDGKLYYTASGETMKVFHVQDGAGIKRLLKHNIHVAIISGRQSEMVSTRMAELGIKDIYQGNEHKITHYNELKNKYDLTDADIAYVGDDLPDIPLIQQAGLGIAVANAVPKVLQQANWHTTQTGGNGAVREVCELIIAEKTAV